MTDTLLMSTVEIDISREAGIVTGLAVEFGEWVIVGPVGYAQLTSITMKLTCAVLLPFA